MIKHHTVLAIIPARGGSLRIPKKNIKPLAGKPLMLYTVESAKGSQYIDRIVLISDSKEIADIVTPHGVEWPYVEPEHLAGPTMTDYDFFSHCLEWLEEHEGYMPDIVVQLRPTSPLRETHHIDTAIEMLANNAHADSIRTVTEPEQTPYKMYGVHAEGHLEPLLRIPGIPESFNLPQQKLPKAYKHVGYVDVMWRKTIAEKKKMTGDVVLPYIIEGAHSGINTHDDWEKYEYLIQRRSAS